jgi:hypothetical protein
LRLHLRHRGEVIKHGERLVRRAKGGAARLELFLDLSQLGPHPLANWRPSQHEAAAASSGRAMVVNSRKSNVSGWDCHENLASAEGKSEELGLDSSRGRCPPIPEGFASEGAERVAGNKMALDVEGVLDGGVNRQEPLR